MAKRWRLKNMRLDRVDLVTAGANPGAHVLIAKFEELADGVMSNDVESSDNVEAIDVSDVTETSQVEPLEAHSEGETVSQEPTAELVDKADVVAKADFEALQKSLEDARAEINKMQRDRKQAEFIAKARDLANLGGADELGGMLLEASEGMSADNFQLLERTLKAANAQVEKGDLFSQFSRTDAEPGSFDEKLNALAKAKVDAGQAATLEIAKLAVLNENPDLRAEYRQSR